MRLHARAPAGTRIEETELLFADIEDEIRQVIPPREIDTIIDNIGIPNGGFNLAFGDSPTIGVERRRDPDLAEAARITAPPPTTPTACASACNEKFPDVVFFFEAANITNQILNFGLPAPIDVQVVGRNAAANYEHRAPDRRARSRRFPGAADVHIHQVVDYPDDRSQRRSQQGRPGRPDAARRRQQPADFAERSGQIAPTQWLELAQRRQLQRRGADAAVPHRFARRAAADAGQLRRPTR